MLEYLLPTAHGGDVLDFGMNTSRAVGREWLGAGKTRQSSNACRHQKVKRAVVAKIASPAKINDTIRPFGWNAGCSGLKTDCSTACQESRRARHGGNCRCIPVAGAIRLSETSRFRHPTGLQH